MELIIRSGTKALAKEELPILHGVDYVRNCSPNYHKLELPILHGVDTQLKFINVVILAF